jgi:hypothetical protein
MSSLATSIHYYSEGSSQNNKSHPDWTGGSKTTVYRQHDYIDRKF